MSTTKNTETTEQQKEDEKEQMRSEVELEFYAGKALAEISDNFQEHSRYYVSNEGEQILVLIPSIKEDSSVLLHKSSDRDKLRDLGFEEGTVFTGSKGAGVKLRFHLNRD